MTLLILLAVAAVLFALSFLTRRRFGALGLGLTAGLVLSDQLAKDVALFLQLGDFPVAPLSHMSAAVITLILAPALLLIFSGPKYSDKRAVIFGSAAFAIFGTVLLLAPLSMSLTLDQAIMPLLSQIAQQTPTIMAAAIILAVTDMMHSQGKKPLDKKSKH